MCWLAVLSLVIPARGRTCSHNIPDVEGEYRHVSTYPTKN